MKTVFKTMIDITLKLTLAGLGFGAVLAFVSWTSGLDAGEWFMTGFLGVMAIVVLMWIIFLAAAIFFGFLDAIFRSLFGD